MAWQTGVIDVLVRIASAVEGTLTVTGGGGGTEYTEGDIDASITGSALLWEDTGDTLRAVSIDKPLPVQGTVTANLGAVDNAVLDTIDAVLDAINAKLVTGTVIGDVNLGATDNAVLDTIDAVLDTIKTDSAALVVDAAAIEVLLGTIDADTGAIKTAVEVIDNAIAGSEMQVDLVTNTDSIDGPGAPVVDSYTQVGFNLTAAADQVLVSSAANKQIWVYGIGFVLSAAGTVSFQDEDNTVITGIMPFAANSGMSVSPSGNFAMPLWKLGTDKDLEIDLVTAECDGWVNYAIISV